MVAAAEGEVSSSMNQLVRESSSTFWESPLGFLITVTDHAELTSTKAGLWFNYCHVVFTDWLHLSRGSGRKGSFSSFATEELLTRNAVRNSWM